MKTRKFNWFDEDTSKVKYGFQVYYEGKWMNACEGTKSLIFDNEEDRDAKQKEISQLEG